MEAANEPRSRYDRFSLSILRRCFSFAAKFRHLDALPYCRSETLNMVEEKPSLLLKEGPLHSVSVASVFRNVEEASLASFAIFLKQ